MYRLFIKILSVLKKKTKGTNFLTNSFKKLRIEILAFFL